MTTWTNWLGNESASTTELHEPLTTAQVVECVERANYRNQRVRVLGSGHAWSPLVPVEGILLSTKRMRAIRSIDAAQRQLTVEAGATIRDVVAAAGAYGLTVNSPSMFLGLSVGGVIATGSHGTGRNSATFGDEVVGFELVTPDGSVVQVSEPGSDRWRAMLCNLGTLGVLTAVTLQCHPMFNVHEVHQRVDRGEAAAVIPTMLAEHEFVELFWVPPAAYVKFKLGNRTDKPPSPVRGRIHPTLGDRLMAATGPVLPYVASVPGLVTPLANLVYDRIGTGTRIVTAPDFNHYNQAYPLCISSEFAIPLEHAPAAWRWLDTRLGRYADAGVRPVTLMVHARFCRASQGFIAPSSGRATCHLEVLSFKGNRHRHLFAEDFETKMRTEFEGRPHWGKELYNPAAAAKGYGANLDAFLEVRHELDPTQRFINPFLRDQVFGLARRPRSTRARAATAA